MSELNKTGSRYRRRMEIRSRNSMRRLGMDPKAKFTITIPRGEFQMSYKDFVIYETKTKMKILNTKFWEKIK